MFRRSSCVAAAVAIFVASLLGAPAAAQSPTPSSSPSPSPSGSQPAAGQPLEEIKPIRLIHPSKRIEAVPVVSDLSDGVDEAYRIVARVAGTTNGIVEAAYQPTGTLENETTLGLMQPVAGQPGAFELFWSIPDSMSEGEGTIKVRLYEQKPGGLEEVGVDEVNVILDHTADPLAGETVAFTWPDTTGRIGFHRPGNGVWRAVFDIKTSPGVNSLYAFYSTTEPGNEVRYTRCGSRIGVATQITCTMNALDDPTKVNAIAVLGEVKASEAKVLSGSSDAMAVTPYVQDPSSMNVEFKPPIGRVLTGSGCISFIVEVTDHLERPVQGANIDIHAAGPNDQLEFVTGGKGVTEAAHGVEEVAGRCPSSVPIDLNQAITDARDGSFTVNSAPPAQGDHNVPGAPDIKHRETNAGSGLEPSLIAGIPGQFRFNLASDVEGFSEITAWVDDTAVESPTDQRPPDSDVLDEGEPFATARAQWLGEAIKVTADPVGDSSVVDACVPYTFRARDGVEPVPSVNFDVHVTGPAEDIVFCDPSGGSERRAPEGGEHSHTEAGHADHSTTDTTTVHTEGETDSEGNFVVGVSSGSPGDTTIVGWVDGEVGQDNDVLAGGEAAGTATTHWIGSLADMKISFLNPSAYGGAGDRISFLADSDTSYEIVTRVDYAEAISGVEIQMETSPNRFTTLGLAQNVAGTDTYSLKVEGIAPGLRKLRAVVPGTEKFVERSVTFGGPTDNPMTPTVDEVLESVDLVNPENGSVLTFIDGIATVSGVASAGAEGIDLFYTKVGAKDSPSVNEWISCGYADLSGTGARPQSFSGGCKLTGSDQPHQVSGIAAIAFDCLQAGCDASPPPPPVQPGMPTTPRSQGQRESGDAHRVFGFDSDPLLALEPAESQLSTDDCHVFTMTVRDQTGQPVRGANVDVHLTHPKEASAFCSSADVAPGRAPDSGGHAPTEPSSGIHPDAISADAHHIEGETLPNGTFSFGVSSSAEGDGLLSAWVDLNDDDLAGPGEKADSALIHWIVIPNDCTVVGTEESDLIRASVGPDRICGLAGDDVIYGLAGDDVIFGGRGADVLIGGPGVDRLRGGPGPDELDGGAERAFCRGGPGRDLSRRCGASRGAEDEATAPPEEPSPSPSPSGSQSPAPPSHDH